LDIGCLDIDCDDGGMIPIEILK
jgi:hypothetical protein